MDKNYFEIESSKPFSESLIWQLNRDYYQQKGIAAWSENLVPHNMTSSSLVGKTYAELILGFLKDLAEKGKTEETVYIIELGAGHGRLAFHILKHLEKIENLLAVKLPPYCFVLSDIVEDNLAFFQLSKQFQVYFKKGVLDVSYFDAVESTEIFLRYNQKSINRNDLNQPIIAIGNYFFDSLPNDLFYIKDQTISSCSVTLQSKENPEGMNTEDLIGNLKATYYKQAIKDQFYKEAVFNDMLDDYQNTIKETYLFFPIVGLRCLQNLSNFSKQGLMLLSMDKGFFEIADIDHQPAPDIVTHGSLSLWVNYHALSTFCKSKKGEVLFPKFSTFHSIVGCLLFLSETQTYQHTNDAYEHFINDFGPDDYNSIKKLTYSNLYRLNVLELIALLRMSAYDSIFFISILPRLKQVYKSINLKERNRVAESFHQVWHMYFYIGELYDLAYELGGMFYDLGFYKDALNYFQYSVELFGEKEDIYYNKVMCFYQLRQDELFYQTLQKAKAVFPSSKLFESLDQLDMEAD